jgi:hypothetical protein
MANITTVRDTLKTFIPTITNFTTKTEILNPYDLTNNPQANIRNGWGLKIGGASATTIDYLNIYGQLRRFEIILTREVIRTEHNRSPIDDNEKNMLIDLDYLMKALESSSQLSIPTAVGKILYTGDNGIEYNSNIESFKLMSMEATFEIEIFENF